jgi:hypothetical protein
MAKVGPVKASFAGDVSLSELNPPNSYLISGKGSGGVAGFAEGGADVRLEDVGGQTRLRYDVDAKVGGKLAQIGSRLIESTARRMAEDFFQRFADAVGGGEEPGTVAPDISAEPGPATPRARKSAAKKSPARKTPARKAAAKSPATRKTSVRKAAGRNDEPAQAAGFTAGPAMAPPPSRKPEAVLAQSAQPQSAQPRSAMPPQNMRGFAAANRNIWWVVGAGIAALLVILLLANA